MAIKKDLKGRNLKQNEDQAKDGRYRYRYTDKYGKRQTIYSWKLVPTDKTPTGKKEDLSLREKIREIERDINDDIHTYQAQSTLNDLIQKYLELKVNIAITTRNNYVHIWEKNIRDSFIGTMRICDIKKSDIKRFYVELYDVKEFSVGTIQLYQNLLFPAFQMAVDDSVIRLNPCRNCMKDFVQGSMSSSRMPLTKDEQSKLLRFAKDNNFYHNSFSLLAFLLGTGCRISEAAGITWNDIDFEKKCVTIDHQVIYSKKNGKMAYFAAPPKTKKSRTIPIQEDLINILKRHKEETFFISKTSSFEVDGYKDFVFINREGKLKTPHAVVRSFHGIRNMYNKQEIENADEEFRDPILLPTFTPHTLRHTYCTRMAENGIDVKVLQELMGHANIAITMQVYNHATFDRVQKAVEETADVLRITV